MNLLSKDFFRTLQFYCEISDRLGEANTLKAIGKLQDNPQQALEYLQQAQNLYIPIADIYSQVATYCLSLMSS